MDSRKNLASGQMHLPNGNSENIWRYQGRLFLYATCPSCPSNVKISENKVKLSLQSVQVRGQSQTAALVEDTPEHPGKEPVHNNYNG